MLSDAVAGATATLQSIAGIAVEYVRGSKSATLTLVPGRIERDQNAALGAKVVGEHRDWIGPTADLLFDAEPFEPRKGDLLVQTVDGKLVSHEVQPAGNEPCWRYADTYRQRIRIHTVTVRVVDA